MKLPLRNAMSPSRHRPLILQATKRSPPISPSWVLYAVASRSLHKPPARQRPCCRFSISYRRHTRVLLVALGWIALEPIDEPGLGSAEGEPIAPGLLQLDEELPTALHRLLVELVPALELGLEGELAAHRMVRAPLAPDGDVRLGGDPPAEVQDPEVLQHLLDDGLVHQCDLVGVGSLQGRQGREHARQGAHPGAITLGRLAQGKLHVVREQQPVAAYSQVGRENQGRLFPRCLVYRPSSIKGV